MHPTAPPPPTPPILPRSVNAPISRGSPNNDTSPVPPGASTIRRESSSSTVARVPVFRGTWLPEIEQPEYLQHFVPQNSSEHDSLEALKKRHAQEKFERDEAKKREESERRAEEERFKKLEAERLVFAQQQEGETRRRLEKEHQERERIAEIARQQKEDALRLLERLKEEELKRIRAQADAAIAAERRVQEEERKAKELAAEAQRQRELQLANAPPRPAPVVVPVQFKASDYVVSTATMDAAFLAQIGGAGEIGVVTQVFDTPGAFAVNFLRSGVVKRVMATKRQQEIIPAPAEAMPRPRPPLPSRPAPRLTAAQKTANKMKAARQAVPFKRPQARLPPSVERKYLFFTTSGQPSLPFTELQMRQKFQSGEITRDMVIALFVSNNSGVRRYVKDCFETGKEFIQAPRMEKRVMWTFKDAKGAEQGPYDTAQMSDFLYRGYFNEASIVTMYFPGKPAMTNRIDVFYPPPSTPFYVYRSKVLDVENIGPDYEACNFCTFNNVRNSPICSMCEHNPRERVMGPLIPIFDTKKTKPTMAAVVDKAIFVVGDRVAPTPQFNVRPSPTSSETDARTQATMLGRGGYKEEGKITDASRAAEGFYKVLWDSGHEVSGFFFLKGRRELLRFVPTSQQSATADSPCSLAIMTSAS